MEVHHHAHSCEKRNWKTYIWELLMLFLTVFFGFLAEKKRRHYAEHQREKKYIQSLIQHLKADTTDLQWCIAQKGIKKDPIHSLIGLLISDKYNQPGSETYFLARQVTRGQAFVSTDGTHRQLKNAGNLRLIRKSNVADSIFAYDRNVKLLQSQDETGQNSDDRFINGTHDLFRSDVFHNMPDSAKNSTKPAQDPQALTGRPNLINNIALEMQYMDSGKYFSFPGSGRLKSKAEDLIKLLKNDYRFE